MRRAAQTARTSTHLRCEAVLSASRTLPFELFVELFEEVLDVVAGHLATQLLGGILIVAKVDATVHASVGYVPHALAVFA